MEKFANSFWGTDFCSTAGFDVLAKRLREGKQMCKDFEEYMEKRARIEKDYGDSLIRLAKNSSGKDEIGTLRESWDTLKHETESSGRIHHGLAQKILDEIHHTVKEFREQQREIRKKSEDTVKRAAQYKKSSYNKCNALKATYDNKCRDADRADENNSRLHSNPQAKAKELAQCAKKMEVTKQVANNADVTYQESVRVLEEARVLWEREMELLCRQFQELEEQRIAYMRHQTWTFCNLCSQETVQVDESCETVRKSLERCDVDADIDLFVIEKVTGTGRPQAVPYINFYHPTDNLGGSGVRVGGAVSMNPSLPPHKEFPPLPPAPMEGGEVGDSVYSSINETVDAAQLLEDGYYAAPKAAGKVVVIYDYEAQGEQELELAEGDIVTIVAREDDVWWCGQSKGKMGMFPSNYVETYDENQ